MNGTLYIVATPIGNLEDITYRAVRILGEVDVIACEDTRQTRKLLQHYGIEKAAVSYHEHNEAARAAELVDRLSGGESVALVSDAGTPLVSDPGYRLVSRAVEAGIRVVPIPGPSSVVTALSASGLPTDAFHFGGFLPAKPGQRRKALEELKNLPSTLVFFETPHRILDALEDIGEILGPRTVVIGRELTKMHEEFLRGLPGDLKRVLEDRGAVKGEITLLIGKGSAPEQDDTPAAEAVEQLIRDGMPRMDAIKEVARRRGLSKREVYRQVEEESTGR
jgi:16S rRNA (cytidine1402-2'-O)-methyltransferase